MATKAEQFRSFVQRSGASRARAMTAPAVLTHLDRSLGRKDHQKAGVGLKAKQLLALLAPRSRRAAWLSVPSVQRRG